MRYALRLSARPVWSYWGSLRNNRQPADPVASIRTCAALVSAGTHGFRVLLHNGGRPNPGSRYGDNVVVTLASAQAAIASRPFTNASAEAAITSMGSLLLERKHLLTSMTSIIESSEALSRQYCRIVGSTVMKIEAIAVILAWRMRST
jgi:hypothetical protein